MEKVVIIGAGPAGLFAADQLHKHGIKSMILEMGKELRDRQCPEIGQCDCLTCDILEGIGGAGGFSDGKNTYSLTRGTQMENIFDPGHQDILKDIRKTLSRFTDNPGLDFNPINEVPPGIAEAGFKMESYPLNHMGTDGIQVFIREYAKYLRGVGVEIESRRIVRQILPAEEDGRGYRVYYSLPNSGEIRLIEPDRVIVASGLQGSPWLESQARLLGIPLISGPAGFGIRLEASASVLQPLFDLFYDFKMTYELNGIIFRSFCCNKNGFVVNENHRTLGIRNVNGHSYLHGVKSGFSNFAIIAKLEDTAAPPQELVRDIAYNINTATGGKPAVQRVEDFLSDRASKPNDVISRTNYLATAGINIPDYLPKSLGDGFKCFLADLSEITNDLSTSEAFVYAPEIKYYGWKFPVDFNTWEVKEFPGLYVIGNASGYLDSFISAALTGVIAANHISQQ